MSKYPDFITPQIVEKNVHISPEELDQDIRDTQKEIDQLTVLKNAGQEIVGRPMDHDPLTAVGFRVLEVLSIDREISERRDFIAFLIRLRTARG